MRKQNGFSLIELLIVVAIILIIAAISIPNLLRARMAANQASAVAAIRTLVTAQITYQSEYPTTGFAGSLAELGPPSANGCPTPNSTTACLIDHTLATSTATPGKDGYIFSVASFQGGTSFAAAGTAVNWNQTGVNSYCAIEDDVTRFKLETSTVSPTTYTGTPAACAALTPLQ